MLTLTEPILSTVPLYNPFPLNGTTPTVEPVKT